MIKSLVDWEPYRSFTVGFDSLWDRLNTLELDVPNYPPYNIRKIDDLKFTIELALAGFTKNDIKVELKEGTLSVSAKKEEKDSDNLVHQGIASRSVLRKFSLSEYMEIKDADFKDGILKIKCFENIPEEKKPKVIKIN